jgi:WD40 repeat protein
MAAKPKVISWTDIEVVSCHAFSLDTSTLALCPNNEEIRILRKKGDEYQDDDILKKHTMRVTGLAFARDGRLVSVSEDRCAYVWTFNASSKSWVSGTVELKATRAALCCQWSPTSERFAVGLASKEIAICQFDEGVGCWVTKKFGRHKASVTTLCWHPTAGYIATGSTDRKWMVIDADDGSPQITEDAEAWVNAVSFNPTGSTLAIAAQDSSVRFKDMTGSPEAAPQRIQWRKYPFLRLVFVNDTTLVACGFDNVPVVFSQSGGQWQTIGSVDAAAQSGPSQTRGSVSGALEKFQGTTAKGSSSGSTHQNTITALSALGENGFATSGLDGQVCLWKLS